MRIAIQEKPGEKVCKTPVTTKRSYIVVHIYNPSCIGSVSRRVMVQASPSKNMRPI
jgi:hypothetical protein